MLRLSALQRLTQLSTPICEAAVAKAALSMEEALDSLNRNQSTRPRGVVGLLRGTELCAILHLSCGQQLKDLGRLQDLAEALVDTLSLHQHKLHAQDAPKRVRKLRLRQPYGSAETVEAALKAATSELMSPVKIKEFRVIPQRPERYIGSYLLRPLSEKVGIAAVLVAVGGDEPIHPEWALELQEPIRTLCQQVLLSRPLSALESQLPASYTEKLLAQAKKAKLVQESLDQAAGLQTEVQRKLERLVLERQPALFVKEDRTVQAVLASLLFEHPLRLEQCAYIDSRWKNQGML